MNQGRYADESLGSFLANLAGPSSEPAGGAALALAAAAAAALVSLSCHSGGRSARDTGLAQTFAATQARSETLMARVQGLIDDDVHAYRDVTQSLRLPHDTQATGTHRREALDCALVGATDVPLAVAQTALDTIDLALDTAPHLDSPVRGDLAAAVHLAQAAIAGSLYNARTNARALTDPARAAAIAARIERTAIRAAAARERAAAVFADARD
jgi:methenyltetrahydrofolate cyclohydrolase